MFFFFYHSEFKQDQYTCTYLRKCRGRVNDHIKYENRNVITVHLHAALRLLQNVHIAYQTHPCESNVYLHVTLHIPILPLACFVSKSVHCHV